MWLCRLVLRLAVPTTVLVLQAPYPAAARPPTLCDNLDQRVHRQGPEAIHSVWDQIQIRSRLFRIQPDWKFRLRVERIEPPPSNLESEYLLFQISDWAYGLEEYQYLIFLREASGCRFVGNIDTHNRYGPPAHRIDSLGQGRIRLILQTYTSTGTGIGKKRDDWYDIENGHVRHMLGYPAEGHESSASSLDQEFVATAVPLRLPNGTEAVDIHFAARYSGGPGPDGKPVELFDTQRTARFVLDASSKRFRLAASRSTASRSYIQWLYGYIIGNEKEFIELHFGELMQVATKGRIEQKQWLRAFIAQLKEQSPKAKVLGSRLK